MRPYEMYKLKYHVPICKNFCAHLKCQCAQIQCTVAYSNIDTKRLQYNDNKCAEYVICRDNNIRPRSHMGLNERRENPHTTRQVTACPKNNIIQGRGELTTLS